MKIKLYKPIAIFEQGKRDNQEDALFPAYEATNHDKLFIVCDGMGGHECGEVASNVVANSISKSLSKYNKKNTPFSDKDFETALQQAFIELEANSDSTNRDMGTTLTMVKFHAGGVFAAHIGDSRIYHIRPSESRILYKSRDHSLVFDLFQAGGISKEDMMTHPKRNVITRAIKPGMNEQVEADITHITDILPGDYFYLCSDGMLESMSDEELLSILASDINNEEKRDLLVDATSQNSDNHTAYLLQVESVKYEAGDDSLLSDERTVLWNALRYEDQNFNSQELDVLSTTVDKKKGASFLNLLKNKWAILIIVVLSLIALAIGVCGYFNCNK